MSRSPGTRYLAGVASRSQPEEGGAAVRAALLPVFVGDGEVDEHGRLDRLGLRSLSGDVGGQRVFVEQVFE